MRVNAIGGVFICINGGLKRLFTVTVKPDIQAVNFIRTASNVKQTQSTEKTGCIQHSGTKGDYSSIGFRRTARQCLHSRIATGAKPQKARHASAVAFFSADTLAQSKSGHVPETHQTVRTGNGLECRHRTGLDDGSGSGIGASHDHHHP